MSLYFVRHGETQANAKRLYYGFLNVPLNEKGRVQVAEAGSYLKHIKFDQVIVSELLRSHETAEAVCPNRDLWRIVPELNEMNFGDWEGLDYKMVSEKFPVTYKSWCDDWLHTAPENGERFVDFYERVCNGFKNLKLDASKNILIAGHNGPFCCLFTRFMEARPEAIWHISFEQGAYSVVDIVDGYPVIRGMNLRHKANSIMEKRQEYDDRTVSGDY